MSKGKNKYYVVWAGHRTGIFLSWPECEKQIKNYPSAQYKAYPTMEEAEEAFSKSASESLYTKTLKAKAKLSGKAKIILPSISVDAACSGNPGLMEYRAVITNTKKEIFKKGPFENGTNNIGEFLALVHALALLKEKNQPLLPIYSDSKTAIAWVKKKKANTKITVNAKNKNWIDILYRAEQWLQANTVTNPILKWDTENWGEIPADFGRK